MEVRTTTRHSWFAVGSVLATNPAERGPLTISAARWHLGGLFVMFEGYADRTRPRSCGRPFLRSIPST